MFQIRNRTYETNDSADIVMSRLEWKVEKVKRLTNPLLDNSTVDTSRPWVGKLDKARREFKIIQTAPYFSPRLFKGNFFQLFVHGQITDQGGKSKIALEFRLGIMTMVFFILVFMFPILAVIGYSKPGNGQAWAGLLMGLVIPIFSTLLLITQLNRTENKLIDLFEI